MNQTLIAPSVLAADFGQLSNEIKAVAKDGADWIHLDVMDGSFVPPITFGANVVEVAKKASNLPLDVHLMIKEPEKHIAAFRAAGADMITIHWEACAHVHRILQSIRESGAKAGLALNPATPVQVAADVLDHLDLLLIMTVNPGWGGQKFIPHSLERIKEASTLISQASCDIHLEVDGGINPETAKQTTQAGADVLVAGTSIFGKGMNSYRNAIDALR